MAKKPPRKKCWEWFSKYYRLKMSDKYGYLTCYTCDKKDEWKYIQVGHLLDGRCNAVLLNEDCVRPQCVGCNMFKAGNKEVYIPKFIDEMGRDFYDELLRLKHTAVKYSKGDYERMTAEFKDKAREEAEIRGLTI